MRNIFRIPLFVWCSLVAAIVGLAFIGSHSKGTENLFFNQYHSAAADTFFSLFTRLGEFPFIAVCLLVFWKLKGTKSAAEAIAAIVIASLSVQFFKRIVFGDYFRPHLFFEQTQPLRIIPNIEPLYHYSFPSGHTTAAFCLFATLSFHTQKTWLKLLFFLLALLTAISRMYLLQHFLTDVVAGVFLGTAVAWLINLYFAKLNWQSNN